MLFSFALVPKAEMSAPGARLSALGLNIEGSDPWVKKRQPSGFGLHFLGY